MFSKVFIVFIERYIAAPAVALLITHGLVDAKHSDMATQVIGEVCGWGFIFLVYFLTHNKDVDSESSTLSGGKLNLKTIWGKLVGFILTTKAQTVVEEATTETTQTLP